MPESIKPVDLSNQSFDFGSVKCLFSPLEKMSIERRTESETMFYCNDAISLSDPNCHKGSDRTFDVSIGFCKDFERYGMAVNDLTSELEVFL